MIFLQNNILIQRTRVQIFSTMEFIADIVSTRSSYVSYLSLRFMQD